MKYKITLNGKTYEVEVEEGQAMLVDEYEAYKPAAPLPPQHLRPQLLPLPLLPQRPPLPRLSPQAEVVAAPMPGNILKVNAPRSGRQGRRHSGRARGHEDGK